MKKLVINVPESKVTLVKQVLKGLGVIIDEKKTKTSTYRENLTKVSTWSEEDIAVVEKSKGSLHYSCHDL